MHHGSNIPNVARWSRVLLQALCIVCLAAMAAAPRASSDLPPSRFSDAERKHKLMLALPLIERLMSERIKEMGIPGVAYGVVIDDEVVQVKGLGVRDVAAGAPADADTVFRIASMTKSFTALAILKLRDAGKLSLDDPVARYVPELSAWQRPTSDSGPITIRHLLSHTAGLPEDNPQGDRVLDVTPAAFSAWLKSGVPFASATGSEFEYSNLGFMILGSVITRVSGRPFQAYITEEVLAPLGMRSTYWSLAAVPTERLAKGYRNDKDSWIAEPMLNDGAGAAMGGLLTSSRDLARYIAMMLSAYPPRDDPERAPVLRRTLREMQSGMGMPDVTVLRQLPGEPLIGRGSSYGFGLVAYRDCDWGREVQHSGGLPGFGSNMRWLPDHGVGILVLANLTYADASSLTRAAMSLLQNTGALNAREAAASPSLERMVRATSDLILDWSDERARAIAADNLFLDETLEERKASIARMRTGLGACKLGKLDAENALRGKFHIDCDHGWLNVRLTLAPVQPPRVQFLEVMAGRPASPALRQSAEAIVKSIAVGPRDLLLAPRLKRSELSAMLESNRLVYGSCRLLDATEGDGVATAKFSLDCDRAPLELTLSLEEGHIANVVLSQPNNAACVP